MSESIDYAECEAEKNKSDFVEIGGNIVKNISLKLGIFTFIFGLFVFSDLFIDMFFGKNNNYADGETTTTKGTIVQLTILCIFAVVINLLINIGWL